MFFKEKFFVHNFVQNMDILKILKNTLHLQRSCLTILDAC